MAISKGKAGVGGLVCSVAAIIAIVMSNGTVRTNKAGLELIGNAESCRREPYNCPAGILTDGIGNTHGVKSGTVKTNEQIAADWEKNILDAEACVNRYGNGRNIGDNAFSAMTSLTFNVGCGAIRTSTAFKLLNSGRTAEACNQLSRWVYSGKQLLPGLVIRRDKERTLCLTKDKG